MPAQAPGAAQKDPSVRAAHDVAESEVVRPPDARTKMAGAALEATPRSGCTRAAQDVAGSESACPPVTEDVMPAQAPGAAQEVPRVRAAHDTAQSDVARPPDARQGMCAPTPNAAFSGGRTGAPAGVDSADALLLQGHGAAQEETDCVSPEQGGTRQTPDLAWEIHILGHDLIDEIAETAQERAPLGAEVETLRQRLFISGNRLRSVGSSRLLKLLESPGARSFHRELEAKILLLQDAVGRWDLADLRNKKRVLNLFCQQEDETKKEIIRLKLRDIKTVRWAANLRIDAAARRQRGIDKLEPTAMTQVFHQAVRNLQRLTRQCTTGASPRDWPARDAEEYIEDLQYGVEMIGKVIKKVLEVDLQHEVLREMQYVLDGLSLDVDRAMRHAKAMRIRVLANSRWSLNLWSSPPRMEVLPGLLVFAPREATMPAVDDTPQVEVGSPPPGDSVPPCRPEGEGRAPDESSPLDEQFLPQKIVEAIEDCQRQLRQTTHKNPARAQSAIPFLKCYEVSSHARDLALMLHACMTDPNRDELQEAASLVTRRLGRSLPALMMLVPEGRNRDERSPNRPGAAPAAAALRSLVLQGSRALLRIQSPAIATDDHIGGLHRLADTLGELTEVRRLRTHENSVKASGARSANHHWLLSPEEDSSTEDSESDTDSDNEDAPPAKCACGCMDPGHPEKERHGPDSSVERLRQQLLDAIEEALTTSVADAANAPAWPRGGSGEAETARSRSPIGPIQRPQRAATPERAASRNERARSGPAGLRAKHETIKKGEVRKRSSSNALLTSGAGTAHAGPARRTLGELLWQLRKVPLPKYSGHWDEYPPFRDSLIRFTKDHLNGQYEVTIGRMLKRYSLPEALQNRLPAACVTIVDILRCLDNGFQFHAEDVMRDHKKALRMEQLTPTDYTRTVQRYEDCLNYTHRMAKKGPARYSNCLPTLRAMIRRLPAREQHAWSAAFEADGINNVPNCAAVIAHLEQRQRCAALRKGIKLGPEQLRDLNPAGTTEVLPHHIPKWSMPCVMGLQVCKEKHPPYDCAAFLGLDASQRQRVIKQESWCTLCFQHYDTARCPVAGKQPCPVAGCGGGHHPVLHHEIEERQTNAVTAHAEQGETNSSNTLHLPRQIINMGTYWHKTAATVLWDSTGSTHFITHDLAHRLKCVAIPLAGWISREDGRGYHSSCRYITYLMRPNGGQVAIEAAGVERIASEHEARTPDRLAERFPSRKLRGWWLDQPAAEPDAMLSISLLDEEEKGLIPVPLETSAFEDEDLSLYRTPYGVGYFLAGQSIGQEAPKKEFSFATTELRPVSPGTPRMSHCNQHRDTDNTGWKETSEACSSNDQEEGSTESWAWDPEPATSEPEEAGDSHDEQAWMKECRHQVCEHPSCPRTIASMTKEMVAAADTIQLEASHPSCDCRCAEVSQMMRDTERMLGRKFDPEDQRDFMHRIQTEYFDPPNRTVRPPGEDKTRRVYRRAPWMADNPSKVSRLQRLWLAALIFTHGLQSTDAFEAFDCSDPPVSVRQYNVLDVGSCPPTVDPPNPAEMEEGVVAQLIGTDLLPVVRCNAVIIMACAPRGGEPVVYYQKHSELSPDACRQANVTGRVSILEGRSAHPVIELVPFQSAGDPVNRLGRYMVNKRDGPGRWSSGWSKEEHYLPVICHAQKKHLTPMPTHGGNDSASMVITVSTEYVTLDPETKEFYTHAGIKLSVEEEEYVDGDVGTYVWDIPPEGCRQRLFKAYEGSFNRTFNGPGAVIEVEAKGTPGGISLTLGRPMRICNQTAWETDINGLVYIKTSPDDASPLARALSTPVEKGARYEYVWKKLIERHIAARQKKERQEEDQLILARSCARAMENKMLRMLIMTGNGETGYYRGYLFRRHGAAIYQTKCRNVSVSLRHPKRCTQEIPAYYDHMPVFVNALTGVISRMGTPTFCGEYAPVIYKIGSEYVCAYPRLRPCEAPPPLPLQGPPSEYGSQGDICPASDTGYPCLWLSGGIDSMRSLEDLLEEADGREAYLANLAKEATNGRKDKRWTSGLSPEMQRFLTGIIGCRVAPFGENTKALLTTLVVVMLAVTASTLVAMWARAVILGHAVGLCWSMFGCLWSELYLWILNRPAGQDDPEGADPQQVPGDADARAQALGSGTTDDAALRHESTDAAHVDPDACVEDAAPVDSDARAAASDKNDDARSPRTSRRLRANSPGAAATGAGSEQQEPWDNSPGAAQDP
jgi:hypothetical protein